MKRTVEGLLAFLMGIGAVSCGPAPPQIPPNVEVLRNVEFGTGGGQPLKLHLVRPKLLPAEPMPVVLFVGGRNDHVLPPLARLAQRGYGCATIDFRMGERAPFPAPLEDCKCAVRFLRAKAKEYHLNPDRIAIWGASQGGHLAVLVGTTGGMKEFEGNGGWLEFSSRVNAVVDWFGLSGYLKEVAQANLTAYATPDDPPFLIMHGDGDPLVPLGVSERLHAALQKAGVEVTFHVVNGGGHGGAAFSSRSSTELLDRFLDTHLKRGQPLASPQTKSDSYE